MTVDRQLLTRKLLLITDLDAVAPFATKPLSTFLQNRLDQAVVERMLERMIGRMIDVNYHLITEGGQPPPPDYHASFVKLGELGIVNPEFARRIARCAGLRNRLVREYEIVVQRVNNDGPDRLQGAERDTLRRIVDEYERKRATEQH